MESCGTKPACAIASQLVRAKQALRKLNPAEFIVLRTYVDFST